MFRPVIYLRRACTLLELAFDKPFDRLHTYYQFVYYVNETVFEQQLKDLGDGCCFIN